VHSPGARCCSRPAAPLLIAAGLMARRAAGRRRRADEPPPVMDELTVTGERTGPECGTCITFGNLWILGSMSPYPKDLRGVRSNWSRFSTGTNQVVVPAFEIGIARVCGC